MTDTATMTAPEIAVGTRVAAIRNGDEQLKTVYWFGEGTYTGQFLPPGFEMPDEDSDIYKLAQAAIERSDRTSRVDVYITELSHQVSAGKLPLEEAQARAASFRAWDEQERAKPIEERVQAFLIDAAKNPRIDLDNGATVWGYQCWWGPLESLQRTFAAYSWELVEVEQ